MRELITIKTRSYSISSTGQKEGSAEVEVGTYKAEVSYAFANAEVTGTRKNLEEVWYFKLRKQDVNFNKDHFITWRSNDYSIIGVDTQAPSSRWITIRAYRSE